MKRFWVLFALLNALISLTSVQSQTVEMGADRLNELLPIIKGKKIALIVNQTSCLTNKVHLLDALLEKNVNVVKIFAPEHGFRGSEDAGGKVVDEKDRKTGIPVISLYGKNYKPSADKLTDVEIVIFDIQDVGTRFYTYISTMHYVMEACAENNKKCIVLDRPNPNDYIDGPILKPAFKSFVGMHPIPVVHGLTIGELAQMINGEGWLTKGIKCDLIIIKMKGWKHGQPYVLPIKPSPNLPNQQAIGLYPSLCFFEATNISVGRGTDFPFQVIGAPNRIYGKFSFTPKPLPGATNPPLKNKVCYGLDLRTKDYQKGLDLSYLMNYYKKSGLNSKFFSNARFMDLLSGTDQLRLQIIKGTSETEIKKSWKVDIEKYKTIRSKYLLYP